MQITYAFIGLPRSVAVEGLITTKFRTLQRLLGHLDPDDVGAVRVEVRRSTRHHHKGDVYEVHAMLEVPRKNLQVTEKGARVPVLVNAAKDKLRGLIEREKERTVAAEHARRRTRRSTR